MASLSFSLGGASKSSRKSSPPPPTNGVKRVHAALDDESDDEDASAGKRQHVTHFDVNRGGAVDTNTPKVTKQPLIIKAQANRDWKEASQRIRRQKYGIPDKEDEAKLDENALPTDKPASYGLNVKDPSATDDTSGQDASDEQLTAPQDEQAPAEPKTDEQRAIDALMGVKQESTLTIPAQTEEEAYQRDHSDAPPAPTLDSYAAVPVEEFGAAMLRGMGWKETQPSKQLKAPERKPALLGIGAKPDAAIAEELGTWGRAAKGRKKPDIIYNPLVLRNPKTGEQLTEDELKAKLQQQKEKDANQIYVSEFEPKEKSSRRREDHDSSERPRRRSKDRRGDDNRRRSRDRRDDDADDRRDRRRHDGHRSRRDRSPSHDRERERRREKGRDEERRRKDYDDYDRGDSRKTRYEDDRKSSSKKERYDGDKGHSRRDRHEDDRGYSRRDRYDDDRDRDSRKHRR